MSKKGRQKLLLGLKILAICGAAVFTVKGVSNFYADAKKEVESREETDRIQDVIESATPVLDVAATTEPRAIEQHQEVSGLEEYHGLIYSMDWDAEESYMLAKIAMAEAESEGVEGKALVMLVVLNRVWSDEFPDSIPEVIFEEGQFSPVGNGRYDRVEPDQECYEALELIQVEKWDESQGALYFESDGKSNWHRNNLQFLFQYGNHYFYRDKE